MSDDERKKAFENFARAMTAVAQISQEEAWIQLTPSVILLMQGKDDRDMCNLMGVVRVLHYYTHFDTGPDGELIATGNRELVTRQTMLNAIKIRDWFNENPKAAAVLPFWKNEE
jgi:hypothetical protein